MADQATDTTTQVASGDTASGDAAPAAAPPPGSSSAASAAGALAAQRIADDPGSPAAPADGDAPASGGGGSLLERAKAARARVAAFGGEKKLASYSSAPADGADDPKPVKSFEVGSGEDTSGEASKNADAWKANQVVQIARTALKDPNKTFSKSTGDKAVALGAKDVTGEKGKVQSEVHAKGLTATGSAGTDANATLDELKVGGNAGAEAHMATGSVDIHTKPMTATLFQEQVTAQFWFNVDHDVVAQAKGDLGVQVHFNDQGAHAGLTGGAAGTINGSAKGTLVWKKQSAATYAKQIAHDGAWRPTMERLVPKFLLDRLAEEKVETWLAQLVGVIVQGDDGDAQVLGATATGAGNLKVDGNTDLAGFRGSAMHLHGKGGLNFGRGATGDISTQIGAEDGMMLLSVLALKGVVGLLASLHAGKVVPDFLHKKLEALEPHDADEKMEEIKKGHDKGAKPGASTAAPLGFLSSAAPATTTAHEAAPAATHAEAPSAHVEAAPEHVEAAHAAAPAPVEAAPAPAPKPAALGEVAVPATHAGAAVPGATAVAPTPAAHATAPLVEESAHAAVAATTVATAAAAPTHADAAAATGEAAATTDATKTADAKTGDSEKATDAPPEKSGGLIKKMKDHLSSIDKNGTTRVMSKDFKSSNPVVDAAPTMDSLPNAHGFSFTKAKGQDGVVHTGDEAKKATEDDEARKAALVAARGQKETDRETAALNKVPEKARGKAAALLDTGKQQLATMNKSLSSRDTGDKSVALFEAGKKDYENKALSVNSHIEAGALHGQASENVGVGMNGMMLRGNAGASASLVDGGVQIVTKPMEFDICGEAVAVEFAFGVDGKVFAEARGDVGVDVGWHGGGANAILSGFAGAKGVLSATGKLHWSKKTSEHYLKELIDTGKWRSQLGQFLPMWLMNAIPAGSVYKYLKTLMESFVTPEEGKALVLGATASIEGSAGIGAAAMLNASFEGGVLHCHGHAGITFGLGAGVGIDLSLGTKHGIGLMGLLTLRNSNQLLTLIEPGVNFPQMVMQRAIALGAAFGAHEGKG